MRDLKERAKKKSAKRAQEYTARQQKLEQGKDEQRVRPHRPSNMLQMLKHKIWSGSQGNLKNSHKDNLNNNSTKFSALVGGTVTGSRGAVKKRAEASKLRQQMENGGILAFWIRK